MSTVAPICNIKAWVDLAELRVVVQCEDQFYDTTNEVSYSVSELDLKNGELLDNIIWFLLDRTVDEFIENKKNAGSNIEDRAKAV